MSCASWLLTIDSPPPSLSLVLVLVLLSIVLSLTPDHGNLRSPTLLLETLMLDTYFFPHSLSF
jgi:hypothetical protein